MLALTFKRGNSLQPLSFKELLTLKDLVASKSTLMRTTLNDKGLSPINFSPGLF